MTPTDKVEFNIEVSETDAREEDIDYMTRQLLAELRELDVESVKLMEGELAPAGSKGDPVAIGSIALELLPVVLPSVVGLVQAWISRRPGRIVKFKGRIRGHRVGFEGSLEELQKLLAMPEKGRKKK